jgi:hypothetical protein
MRNVADSMSSSNPKVVLGMAPVLGVFGLFCALFLIDLL